MLGVLVAVLLELNRLVTLGRQQTYVLMQEKQAIVCNTRRRPGSGPAERPPGAFFSWTQYFCTSPSLYMQTDSSD